MRVQQVVLAQPYLKETNGGNGGTINAGSNATGGGGGGGWGAAGGNSANYTGGSAGRALDGFGTVTNSGSIYGAT